MGEQTISELDEVVLLADCGQWAAGTGGTVVDLLDAETAMVEFAGPDGRTLDLVEVPFTGLVGCDLGVPRGSRLAG